MNEMSEVAARKSPQPETRDLNFFRADASLRALLKLYLPDEERAHMEPVFARLGGLVGDELDMLARDADRNPPVLRARDRQGADRQSLEKHPAYREMERLAYGDFALAAMAHRPAFGWHAPLSSMSKYVLTYLFAQSEFGLLCPVNMTDSLTRTIRRFAAPELVARYLAGLTAEDPAEQIQGAMFMTERFAGSDVGATETRAVRDGERWWLYGRKWFCSNADAGLALVLARPEGADVPAGTRGLGLFLMPSELEDGSPNRYRIVRLKDKLGTRSMASGEIDLDGAEAWLVGELSEGFRQMAEMVNQSRLSNAVRSAGMMRRALHEAFAVARGRSAFGRCLIDLPLVRRQLAKMILPAEQALSMVFFTARCLDEADAGDTDAQTLRRVLTPLVKFRVCRDARKVTGDAMEMRGGCGYIEEWIEPRLLRDSHLGSIWEGTSNIIALDVIRASRKTEAHRALAERLRSRLAELDGDLGPALEERLGRAVALIDDVAGADGARDAYARQAASGLYHAVSAVLMADEARRLGDPHRARLAALVRLHRLGPRDPLAAGDGSDALENSVVDAWPQDAGRSP